MMKVSSLNRFKSKVVSVVWVYDNDGTQAECIGVLTDITKNTITLDQTFEGRSKILVIDIPKIRGIEELEKDNKIALREKEKFREEIKKVIKLYRDPWKSYGLGDLIKLCLTYRQWDKHRVIKEIEEMVEDGELIKITGMMGDTHVGLQGEKMKAGELDIDRIVTGITSAQRSRIITVRELIRELEAKYGSNIPTVDLTDAAKEKGIDESKVNDIIDRLKHDGELFEPKKGIIRRVPK